MPRSCRYVTDNRTKVVKSYRWRVCNGQMLVAWIPKGRSLALPLPLKFSARLMDAYRPLND